MTTITQFKDRYAKIPNATHSALDGAGFKKLTSDWKHVVNPKKDAAGVFTFCEYGSAKDRKKESVVAITGIVLDIDGGNSQAQIIAAIEKLQPYAHCYYTTHRHAEANPKLRIAVPLAQSLTVAEFEGQAIAMRLAAMLDLKVDDCCAGASQAYYLPSKPTLTAEAAIGVGDSTTFFDIGLLPAVPAKPGKSASGKEGHDPIKIYQQIDELNVSMFGGVQPLFVGEEFHVYHEGVWHAVAADRAFCKDVIEHHSRKVGIADAQALVSAMKIMFSCDAFPAADTGKITLENGTLNVATRALEPHAAGNYHRSGMGFDYDPDAGCPLWFKTLDDIFWPDADREQKIGFLQEWIGYLLTPSVKYQVMVMMYGGGSNGKSVITHITRALLGAVNVCSIPLQQLSARFIGAEMEGKLANIIDEMGPDSLLKEEEIKKAISADPILVERKNKDPYFFTPTARIFAATNLIPPSRDSTYALERRLIILTFNRQFTLAEVDRDRVTKLEKELPGIFVWALAGLERLTRQGKFTQPPSCIEAMDDFKVGRNSVALFKRDCLALPDVSQAEAGAVDKSYRTTALKMYDIYKAYCAANRYQAYGKEGFGKKLKELGVEQVRSAGKRFYLAKLVNLGEHGLSDLLSSTASNDAGYRDCSINDEFLGDADAA